MAGLEAEGHGTSNDSLPGATSDTGFDVVERVLRPRALHHEVLGLPGDVALDPSTLRKAYLRTALHVHPDKCAHPSAGEAFRLISRAYDVLLPRAKAGTAPCPPVSHGGSAGDKPAGFATEGDYMWRKNDPASAASAASEGKAKWWERQCWRDIEKVIKMEEQSFQAEIRACNARHELKKASRQRKRKKNEDHVAQGLDGLMAKYGLGAHAHAHTHTDDTPTPLHGTHASEPASKKARPHTDPHRAAAAGTSRASNATAAAELGYDPHRRSCPKPKPAIERPADVPEGLAYDERTGHWYDSNTKYYWDATHACYYDGVAQTYKYWDAERNIFIDWPFTDAVAHPSMTEDVRFDTNDQGRAAEAMNDQKRAAEAMNDQKRAAEAMDDQKRAAVAATGVGAADTGGHLPADARLLAHFSGVGVDAWEAAQQRGHVNVDDNTCLLCQRKQKPGKLEKHVRKSQLHMDALEASRWKILSALT